MEWLGGILGETVEEKLHERVNVLPCNRTGVYGVAILIVGVTDLNWLVEEDDVGVLVPTVWIVCRVMTLICDAAGSELEEETS